MKKKYLKTSSIIFSILLILCGLSSIISYGKITEKSDYIKIDIDHIPHFPVVGEEVTFFITLKNLNIGSNVNYDFYNGSDLSGESDISGVFTNIEQRIIEFTIEWTYFEADDKRHARLLVQDSEGAEGNKGDLIRIGIEDNREITVTPEIQEPGFPITFKTDELNYDACGWILDERNPPSDIEDGYSLEGLIDTGISGYDEEKRYNGRFIEVKLIDEHNKEYYITKFSYEVSNLYTLQSDYDDTIDELDSDKDKVENFNSDGKSFLRLFYEISDTDTEILNELFTDISGNNMAEDITTLLSVKSSNDQRSTSVLNLNNKLKNLDTDTINEIINYLINNEITSIEDIPFGTEPFIIPDWAEVYQDHEIPWIEESDTELSKEEVIKKGMNFYKDELINHLDSENKLNSIFEHIATGLEIDLLTIAIWFISIFILSVVVVSTLPNVAIFISLVDALILSILTVFLLDNANFQENIDLLISKFPLPYGLNEMDWEGIVSIVIFGLVFGSVAGLCLVPTIATLVSSLTIVGITASAYVIVPIIKDKLDFGDDDENPKYVQNQVLNSILIWIFNKYPDSFPLLRKIFGIES